ncbi:CTP-dependent diacylglycerol kinase 1 [Trametes pubescens]|uniref:CTP-dependent diacylglycerol kinase 1 n=1 Tax=Trametes pubescens TaxID=154538 RepID=A0A1M2V9D3_TRAPU|nr:CTP-dependent diacylglycerol kinase 1 [Trametes pubescens]
MSIPANDAFTLGPRLGLPSSSSKIPFVSGSPKARSPSASTRSSKPSRQMSVELNDSLASRASPSNGTANGHTSPLRQRKRPRSTSPTAAIASSAPSDSSRSAKTGKTAKQKIDWEIPRKTLHSSIGFLTLYLYASDGDPRNVVLVLSLALAIIVPADILRLRSTRFERIYERCLGFLMRESEKKSTNGVIWYIIGVIFVLAVYPLDIATVAILILSWADTAASTVGRMFGAYTPPLPRKLPLLRLPLAPRKSLAGFLAGAATGAAIAVGFWGWFAPDARAAQLAFYLPAGTLNTALAALPAQLAEIGTKAVDAVQATGVPVGRWLGLGTLGAVCGLISGTAEALDLGSLDDNLTLPIISGGCIWGFFKVLEWFTGSG